MRSKCNLIAYSDDEDPLGIWYMYRLDTKMHGTIPSNTWGDYPHVGFDEEALYISTGCTDFAGGGHQYNKIRIISKSELYNSNGGSLNYTDIWEIHVPGEGSESDTIDYIQPGITGWAQIHQDYGSSVEDAKIKLEFDLYYIKRKSLYLDLVILLRTITKVLGFKGR